MSTDTKDQLDTTENMKLHSKEYHKKKFDKNTDCRKVIVCVNLSENKFYCYNQRGLLIYRYGYEKEVTKFGKPVATSQNGLNFLLMKRSKDHSDICLTVFHISEVNFIKIKHFSLYE